MLPLLFKDLSRHALITLAVALVSWALGTECPFLVRSAAIAYVNTFTETAAMRYQERYLRAMAQMQTPRIKAVNCHAAMLYKMRRDAERAELRARKANKLLL